LYSKIRLASVLLCAILLYGFCGQLLSAINSYGCACFRAVLLAFMFLLESISIKLIAPCYYIFALTMFSLCHVDCIGSAFNIKGAMQCPNCRKIEKGQWLYANGSRSYPEFSMDDWTHDEDLYDLSYSEMVTSCST
jgi:hypothetical protein